MSFSPRSEKSSSPSSAPITPFVLGTGRAGHAIAQALASLSILEPNWNLDPVRWIERGTPLASVDRGDRALLAVANPHGLHARTLLEADAAGWRQIVCEKPSCVSAEEVAQLRVVKSDVAIFHGYRMMWGPQTLRRMLTDGELGEWISLEGRYWQSSSAERAIAPPTSSTAGKPSAWKNSIELAGRYDVFLDLGTHFADLAAYLAGEKPGRVWGWRSYKNAESATRDSHVQFHLEFSGARRANGSVSKTVHGATNHLELSLLGTRRSATWNFLAPDEIWIGEGRNRRVLTRQTADLGGKLPPFHAMGWLEGYVEILRQAIGEMFFDRRGEYPRLGENLDLLATLFAGKFEELA